jgi:uncharacterized Zn-binding protein involved in type VI secretion
MGKPAARISDMHICPMTTGPVPHVGGPIVGPGVPTVLIGGIPAAVMGDLCTCTGPPDTIILGSTGVLIGGKPAARMGDMCAHGGSIIVGCPTVLIGETMPGGPVIIDPILILGNAINGMNTSAAVKAKQIAELKGAALTGSPLVHNAATCPNCAKSI